MFWFIVLLLVVGAGFYFYQKMMAIEREIRAEQVAANEHVSPEPEPEPEPENLAADVFKPTSSARESQPAAAVQGRTAIEEAIMSVVAEKPGIKQTDLYPLFADTGKKQLQKLIKNMADNGVLRREKQGSSYLLYCP